MFRALQTVVLKDVFGRDNQYLKGHKYDLTYSEQSIEKFNGRNVQSIKVHQILSNSDIEEYFVYEEEITVRGGIASRVLYSNF